VHRRSPATVRWSRSYKLLHAVGLHPRAADRSAGELRWPLQDRVIGSLVVNRMRPPLGVMYTRRLSTAWACSARHQVLKAADADTVIHSNRADALFGDVPFIQCHTRAAWRNWRSLEASQRGAEPDRRSRLPCRRPALEAPVFQCLRHEVAHGVSPFLQFRSDLKTGLLSQLLRNRRLQRIAPGDLSQHRGAALGALLSFAIYPINPNFGP